MVKLVTTDSTLFGRKLSIPYAGEVEVSEEGAIQVSDKETADNVVASGIGFGYSKLEAKAPEAIKPKAETAVPLGGSTETPPADTPPAESTPQGTEETPAPAAETTPSQIDLLKGMNMPQLQEFAKPFPGSEWKELRKPDLLAYLIAKLEG